MTLINGGSKPLRHRCRQLAAMAICSLLLVNACSPDGDDLASREPTTAAAAVTPTKPTPAPTATPNPVPTVTPAPTLTPAPAATPAPDLGPGAVIAAAMLRLADGEPGWTLNERDIGLALGCDAHQPNFGEPTSRVDQRLGSGDQASHGVYVTAIGYGSGPEVVAAIESIRETTIACEGLTQTPFSTVDPSWTFASSFQEAAPYSPPAELEFEPAFAVTVSATSTRRTTKFVTSIGFVTTYRFESALLIVYGFQNRGSSLASSALDSGNHISNQQAYTDLIFERLIAGET